MPPRRKRAHRLNTPLDLRMEAETWDGPHYQPFSCGVSYFEETPPRHALFMDAMEPEGCWEYVVSGCIQYQIGSERHRVGPGEALVTRRPDPGWMLRPVKDEPVHTLWVSVTGRTALEMFDFLHLKFGQIQRLQPKSRTLRLARQLIRLAEAEPRRSEYFWSRKTFEWMNAWGEEMQQNHPKQTIAHLDAIDPSRLVSYAPQTVKQFAAEMGYSRVYLTRKLTQQWRRSPGKVLREVRLQDAANLLRTTRLSISDVAAKVGYNTTSGFCRAFARQYGQTPMAYRRSHR